MKPWILKKTSQIMVLFSFNSPVELEIALAIESPPQSQERWPLSPTAGPAHQGA